LPLDSIEHGAARVTAAVVPIFDKSDGTGADWRLMTESLFKAAFKMLDGLPDDVRQSVAWRVHEGSYRRAVLGPIENAEDKARPEGVFTGVSGIM
jgi:hypothetical protein